MSHTLVPRAAASLPVTVDSVVFQPETPSPGDDLSIIVSATTGVATSKGNVEVYVKYRGVLVYQETEDLCTRTTCPVKEGELTLTTEQKLPPVAPPVRFPPPAPAAGRPSWADSFAFCLASQGPYSVQVGVLDDFGTKIMCVEVQFNIGEWKTLPRPPPGVRQCR